MNPAADFEPLPEGTLLETDDEIESVRQALGQLAAATDSKPSLPHGPRDAPSPPSAEQPYRPQQRIPQAWLTVCDDGQKTGEIIRLREARFLIGRTEGDLRIADDEQISSRHLALNRQIVAGRVRWAITDLQSRNGLFVRVRKAPLGNQAEILVGRGRYRLEIVQSTTPETAALDQIQASTRLFEEQLRPGTVLFSEVLTQGVGSRTILTASQYRIGRGPECEIQRLDDPCTAAVHASLAKSPRGTWIIEGLRNINGIWLKVPQIVVDPGQKCEFQIGEQRFRLRFGNA